MGLAAISRGMGLSPDTTLAVVATMLGGLAGPDAWIQSPWGPRRLPKTDLITVREEFRIQRWIEQLSSPLELMQQRLVQNMGRTSPDALELLACGAYSSPATARLADQDTRDKTLRRNMDILTRSSRSGACSGLLEDLADDPIAPRLESILHPQFLLRRMDGSHLKSQVENCHLRAALVVQPVLGLERAGSEPQRVMRILTALLDGATITKRPASIERGRDSSLLATAHAILALTKAELDALHAMDGGHLDRFLLLKEGDRPESRSGGGDACRRFQDIYQHAIEEILGLRRKGFRLTMAFETEKSATNFEFELGAYELEIEGTAGSAGPWARGLPQSLFWALGFLRRSIPTHLRPDDESLSLASFAVARRLVANHCDQVRRLTHSALLADRRAMAKRIVAELSKGGTPVRFREITRFFKDQRKERIAPVTDALVEVGVLVLDHDGFYTLGPVELADAEKILNQKFAQP